MKRRRILLVDDDTSLLVTLADFLESEGYDVVKAESGERALVLLRSARPDLIVLDMSMPGIGGMGVLDRITRPDGTTRCPVLVLTARAAMAEYFANKQIAGFLAKPCAPNDLALEISRIIFQGAGEDEAATAAPAPPPRVVLGEADAEAAEPLRRGLRQAGFEVDVLPSGPELVEATVLARPDAVVLRLGLPGLPTDGLVRMLRQMRNTRSVPLVIYGIDRPGVPLEQVAGLDEKEARLLAGLDSGPVTAAVRAALRRP
jgi:DNA-binding response OmpR family regulator